MDKLKITIISKTGAVVSYAILNMHSGIIEYNDAARTVSHISAEVNMGKTITIDANQTEEITVAGNSPENTKKKKNNKQEAN